MDRPVRPKRIADVLKEINANIIALQEVEGLNEGSREPDHLHRSRATFITAVSGGLN